MLNHAEIALLVAELQPWLGAVVQRAQQGAPETLTLALRRPGSTRHLHFALERGNPRFHFVAGRAPALPRPPAFSMALRKHLGGARLGAVRQPDRERIIHLEFEKGGRGMTLVAELLPAAPNLLLVEDLDQSGGRLLARMFRDDRNVGVGRPYIAPAPPPQREDAERVEARVREWTGASFHDYLAELFAEARAADSDEERRRERARREAKRDRLLARLQADWERAGDPDRWRRYGDLLAARPALEPQGKTTLETADDDGRPVSIPVLPELTRNEQIDWFYRRARKADSARRHIAERRRLVETDALDAAPRSGTPEDDAAKRPEPMPLPANLPKGHAYRFAGGSLVMVGRSAAENDRITFGWARPDDVWMHARDVTGAHVVVRHSPADEREALLDDAARLALHYSSRRGEAAGDVHMTQRRYLQSMKGAPGKVRILREENRRVGVSRDDLERLEILRLVR